MRAKGGQVAVYLAFVLAAVLILAVACVDVFLSVRSKNRAMNAGDAAALAAANRQGELLNEIGRLNVDRLRYALGDDRRRCDELLAEQRRLCFLGPLDCLRVSNEAARRNGVEQEPDDRMKDLLRRHVSDIRLDYETTPELYPEPWEGAWEEYAAELETILGGPLAVGADNAEYANAWTCDPLVRKAFYNAVAGRLWCWFRLNGMEWVFDCDSHTMPQPDFSHPTVRHNSEFYSLHLTFRPIPLHPDEAWTNLVCRLTGCCEADVAASTVLTNQTVEWAFFDTRWNAWSTYPGVRFHPDTFPIVGEVRREYDVLGCAAKCRVLLDGQRLEGEAEDDVVWTAAAKPFGTVENLDGELDAVTSLKRLVTPAFTCSRLVPTDAVSGLFDTDTADADWCTHVRDHLPDYFEMGPAAHGTCWYCQQLLRWEGPGYRAAGRNWLRFHQGECSDEGPGTESGGTAHAH